MNLRNFICLVEDCSCMCSYSCIPAIYLVGFRFILFYMKLYLEMFFSYKPWNAWGFFMTDCQIIFYSVNQSSKHVNGSSPDVYYDVYILFVFTFIYSMYI